MDISGLTQSGSWIWEHEKKLQNMKSKGLGKTDVQSILSNVLHVIGYRYASCWNTARGHRYESSSIRPRRTAGRDQSQLRRGRLSCPWIRIVGILVQLSCATQSL